MADLSITPANVLSSSQDGWRRAVAAVAIAAGDLIFKDSTGLKLSDANGVAAAKKVDGIALNSAASGQPVTYTPADAQLTPGGTVTEGTIYVLSATAGKMCPAADLASGMAAIFVGAGLSGNKINFNPQAGGTVA